MTKKSLFSAIMIILIVIIFSSCVAGPNSKWKEPPEPTEPPEAGFLAGLWHGVIAVITLILGIFTDIKVYEIHNSGWFYDLGFLLGVGAFSHSGVSIVHKKSKSK